MLLGKFLLRSLSFDLHVFAVKSNTVFWGLKNRKFLTYSIFRF